VCVTMSYMKGDTITVRLDDDLGPLLDEVCRRSGRTRSEVMREALRRHLVQLRFEQLRRRVMPFAEARDYLTDEDVFDAISSERNSGSRWTEARSAAARSRIQAAAGVVQFSICDISSAMPASVLTSGRHPKLRSASPKSASV
jgi:predicted transcriptional regulator